MIWFAKLGRMLLVLVGLFRRALCCFRRRRRNSDTPLPVTVKGSSVHHISSLPVDSIDNAGTHSWTTWNDSETPSGVTVVANNYQSRSTNNVNGMQRNGPAEILEPEIDFFQDMTPSIKKTDKIILRKVDNMYDTMDNVSILKRFAADSFIPSTNAAELGHMHEDEVGWEDSLNNDNDYDADTALRESKLKERERRAAENLRKKQARDALRLAKKDHLATKIS